MSRCVLELADGKQQADERYRLAMSDWHFLVDRDDYRNTRVVDASLAALDDGEVRLRVDAFGFTANNITYAAAGDMIGYSTFFPAPDLGDDVNWGRVPVWGFADVVESLCDGVVAGERLFGYLPMSTELVIRPEHVSAASLRDGAAHRAALPAVYNHYERCAASPGYHADLEAEQMLYRPLFFTAFLIDDFLADNDFFGATTIVLASASSKTAFGTAHLLSKRDGLSVLTELRRDGNNVHVLLLTARDAVADRVKGLQAGADDYLIKPFALEEFLARVGSLCRRSYGRKQSLVAVGDLQVDSAARTVRRSGEGVELTPREFQLLEYLVRRVGEVVSRTEIESHIYDDQVDPMSNVVDSAICNLRRKLAVSPTSAPLIHTRRGMGYILENSVS